MDIDWNRTYRIFCNNLVWFGGKPNKETLKSLGMALPNCQVVGFGWQGWLKSWYLLVYDPSFPDSINAANTYMTWYQATKSQPPKFTQGSGPPQLPPGSG